MNKVRLPNFLCVGAPKCGTTTLHEALAKHPEVRVPSFKEPCFFSTNYERGLDWYSRTYFRDGDDAIAMGECSPDYISDPRVPLRILNDLGKGVKLIFILRDPVSRAYSHFLHQVRDGVERRSFREAMDAELSEIKGARQSKVPTSRYIWDGLYGTHLHRYLEFFSIDQMKILSFEDDIVARPKEAMDEIYSFLGISEHEYTPLRPENVAREVPGALRFMKSIVNRDSVAKRIAKSLIPLDFLQKARNEFNRRTNALGRPISTKLSSRDVAEIKGAYFSLDRAALGSITERCDIRDTTSLASVRKILSGFDSLP